MTVISGGIYVNVDTTFVDAMFVKLEAALHEESLIAFLDEEAQPYFIEQAKQRFAEEGDDASGKWAQLSEVTNQIREYMGFPPEHPINVRTGKLKAYVETPVAAIPEGFAASFTWPGPDVDFKTHLKYLGAQEGTEGEEMFGGAPERPVVATNMAADLAKLLEMFSTRLEGLLSL